MSATQVDVPKKQPTPPEDQTPLQNADPSLVGGDRQVAAPGDRHLAAADGPNPLTQNATPPVQLGASQLSLDGLVSGVELKLAEGGKDDEGICPPLRRPNWTQEEDELLADFVAKNGLGEWAAAAALLPGRSKKQCRNRWYNALASASKKAPWTKGEESELKHLYRQYGEKWTTIAKHLPGRSRSEVKSHWSKQNGCKTDGQSSGAALLQQFGLQISGEKIVSIPEPLATGAKQTLLPSSSSEDQNQANVSKQPRSGIRLPGKSDLPRLDQPGADGALEMPHEEAIEVLPPPLSDVISSGVTSADSTGLSLLSGALIPPAADVIPPSRRLSPGSLPRLGGRSPASVQTPSPATTSLKPAPKPASEPPPETRAICLENVNGEEPRKEIAPSKSAGEQPGDSSGQFDWVKEWVALSNRYGYGAWEQSDPPGGEPRPNPPCLGSLGWGALSNDQLKEVTETLQGGKKAGPDSSASSFRLRFFGGPAPRPETPDLESVATVPLGRFNASSPLQTQPSFPMFRAQSLSTLRQHGSADLPLALGFLGSPRVLNSSEGDQTTSEAGRKRKPEFWVEEDSPRKRFRSAGGPNRADAGEDGAPPERFGVGQLSVNERPSYDAVQGMLGLGLGLGLGYSPEAAGRQGGERGVAEPSYMHNSNSLAGGSKHSTGQALSLPGYRPSDRLPSPGRGFQSYRAPVLGAALQSGENKREENAEASVLPVEEIMAAADYVGAPGTAHLTTLVTEHLNSLLEAQGEELSKAGGPEPGAKGIVRMQQAHQQMKAAVQFLTSLTGAGKAVSSAQENVPPEKEGPVGEPGDNRSYSDCSPGALGSSDVAHREPHDQGGYGAGFGLDLGDATDAVRSQSWPADSPGSAFKGQWKGGGWAPLDTNPSADPPLPLLRGLSWSRLLD